MSTSLEVDLDAMPLLDHDGPTHLTCCEDDHLAHCGKQLRGDDFEPDNSPVTCAECIASDEMNFCPKVGKCRY